MDGRVNKDVGLNNNSLFQTHIFVSPTMGSLLKDDIHLFV